MYLHIGGNYEIPAKLILGIFDIEETNALDHTSPMGQYLKMKEENQEVELIDLEIPKTMIVTLEKVFLSPITYQTMQTRISNLQKRWK